jgi:hypothetical protein
MIFYQNPGLLAMDLDSFFLPTLLKHIDFGGGTETSV